MCLSSSEKWCIFFFILAGFEMHGGMEKIGVNFPSRGVQFTHDGMVIFRVVSSPDGGVKNARRWEIVWWFSPNGGVHGGGK